MKSGSSTIAPEKSPSPSDPDDVHYSARWDAVYAADRHGAATQQYEWHLGYKSADSGLKHVLDPYMQFVVKDVLDPYIHVLDPYIQSSSQRGLGAQARTRVVAEPPGNTLPPSSRVAELPTLTGAATPVVESRAGGAAWRTAAPPRSAARDFLDAAITAEPFSATAVLAARERVGSGGASMSSAAAALVDVGCGSSFMGLDLCESFPGAFSDVVLTDVSPAIVDILRRKLQDVDAPTSGPPGMLPVAGAHENTRRGPRIHCLVCDCRHMFGPVTAALSFSGGESGPQLADTRSRAPISGIADSQQEDPQRAEVRVVLDKGTLDALDGEADKLATIGECAKLLLSSRRAGLQDVDGRGDARTGAPHGGGRAGSTRIFVSISFGTASRVGLLERAAVSFGFDFCHIHVIGSGDPARGNEIRFLSILGYGSAPEYRPSKLTELVLGRVKVSGSVMEEVLPGGDLAWLLDDLFEDRDG